MPTKLLNPDTRYLYVIRRVHTPIDIFDYYEDAVAELPQKFMFGSVDGNIIDTMKTVIQEVKICIYIYLCADKILFSTLQYWLFFIDQYRFIQRH